MATNSSTAEVHLFERLMQTQGGGDGFSTSPTVNGADAEERYWTSPPVKYESVCMRLCGCVCACVSICVCVCVCARVQGTLVNALSSFNIFEIVVG